jgi:hypothetical protein
MCLIWGSPCDEGRLKLTNDERAGNTHGCIPAQLVALLSKDNLFEAITVGARQNAFASLVCRSVDAATLHLEINHSKVDNDRQYYR